jgi:hypothetical protein
MATKPKRTAASIVLESIISSALHESPIAYGTGKISESKKKVNARSIMLARKKLLHEDCDIHRSIAAQFVGPVEKWEYDNDGIDALVQVILFDKVVYG